MDVTRPFIQSTKGSSIKDIPSFWLILDLLTYLYPIFRPIFGPTYLSTYIYLHPIFANLLTNWNVGYPLWTAPKGIMYHAYAGQICFNH